MKRITAIFISLILLLLAACGTETQDDGKLHIVTTVFAEYDWVKNIVGGNENVEITLLLDSGVDLHSYQPTAEDILNITTSDLFVFVGGESDEWAEDLLKTNTNVNALRLLDVLGADALEEEIVEGMEAAAEEDESGDTEYDEHIWLSLRNAEKVCAAVCDELCAIDSVNASLYRENTEKYTQRLNELDKKYEQAVSEASVKTLIFGDRFPFRYLTDDYNITYYAAFVGCSAESEASFETIEFLSEKADELGISKILVIDGSSKKLAQTIIDNTASGNAEILEINSMQAITAADVAAGADYIDIMESNLTVLRNALS